MSHFIIWSYSATYFGTPNGHARTQLEQPMQRGLRDDCTTPSSFCLIASAGHTSAQVGSSQCMHTVGAVWVEAARSTSSRWIIDRRRWGPHSSHACTQGWQPMQRLWSTTKMLSPDAPATGRVAGVCFTPIDTGT